MAVLNPLILERIKQAMGSTQQSAGGFDASQVAAQLAGAGVPVPQEAGGAVKAAVTGNVEGAMDATQSKVPELYGSRIELPKMQPGSTGGAVMMGLAQALANMHNDRVRQGEMEYERKMREIDDKKKETQFKAELKARREAEMETYRMKRQEEEQSPEGQLKLEHMRLVNKSLGQQMDRRAAAPSGGHGGSAAAPTTPSQAQALDEFLMSRGVTQEQLAVLTPKQKQQLAARGNYQPSEQAPRLETFEEMDPQTGAIVRRRGQWNAKTGRWEPVALGAGGQVAAEPTTANGGTPSLDADMAKYKQAMAEAQQSQQGPTTVPAPPAGTPIRQGQGQNMKQWAPPQAAQQQPNASVTIVGSDGKAYTVTPEQLRQLQEAQNAPSSFKVNLKDLMRK